MEQTRLLKWSLLALCLVPAVGPLALVAGVVLLAAHQLDGGWVSLLVGLVFFGYIAAGLACRWHLKRVASLGPEARAEWTRRLLFSRETAAALHYWWEHVRRPSPASAP